MPTGQAPREPAAPENGAHAAAAGCARGTPPRHAPACALAGLASSALVLLGEVDTGARVTPPAARWAGHLMPGPEWGPVVGLAGLAGMLAAWLWLVRIAETLRLRSLVAVAALWALPLLLAGPVLSADAYAYGALGEEVRRGLDPYATGPAAMGSGTFLAAMDPGWASVPAPYGPLAVLLFRLADRVGGDRLGPTLAVLRIAVALATAAAVFLAVRTAAHRRTAVAFVAAGPVVTVSLVGALHVDALAAAAAAGAAVAWRSGRRGAALVLAGLATAVKASLGVLVVALLVAAVAEAPPGRRLRLLASAAAAAAAAYLVPAALTGHPFGVLHAVATPYRRVGTGSPASVVVGALGPALSWLPGGLGTAVGFGILQAAGLCGAAWALGAGRRRDPAVAAGVALVAIVVTSPVVHSWYLAWPLVLLGPVLTRPRVLPWAGAVSAYCLLADAARPALPSAAALVLGLAAACAVAAFLALRPTARPVPVVPAHA